MPKLNIHIGDEVFEDWGPKTVLIPEAVAIERAYGKTFSQFVSDIDGGSMYAKQVLAWALLRRSDPGLKVDEVTIPIGDVRLEVIPDAETETGADADPFRPGSSEAGQNQSATDEPDTSQTSQTSSESDLGSGTA